MTLYPDCPDCNGDGRQCERCGGRGVVAVPELLAAVGRMATFVAAHDEMREAAVWSDDITDRSEANRRYTDAESAYRAARRAFTDADLALVRAWIAALTEETDG